MLKHCIKIAVRNLVKQKGFGLINILGLTIGMACFSMFLLYAAHEFSFDRFHTNANQIYRVYDWWNFEGRSGKEPSSVTPLGPAMKSDLPDVEDYVRIQGGGEKLVKVGDKVLSVKVSFADPQLFSVFTFPLLAGDPSNPLKGPNHIVLTKDKALQLFGEIQVVGKQVEIKTGEKYELFIVGGVADNIPHNSTIRFDVLGSFAHVLNTDMGRASMDNWNMTIGIQVYVKLKEGSDLMNEPERLAIFRQRYFPEDEANFKEKGLWNGEGQLPNGYALQPLRDVHTGVEVDKWGAVDPRNIMILISIAFGILLIACVNFITLAIGRSAGRSVEIGVRKVVGGKRRQLVYQLLAESMLLSVLSALLGIILVYLLLPVFNELSGRTITFSFRYYPEMIGILAGTTIMAGLLSGLYPAVVVSAFKPIAILKNRMRFAGSNIFTKSLVTFQFALSIGLVGTTFIILKQLSFMYSKDLGFDKENVVMVATNGADGKKIYPLFRQILESDSRIAGVSGSEIGLGAGSGQMGRRYDFDGKEETVIEYPIDPGFLETLGMQLIAGRDFNPEITSDTISAVIVNEALVNNVWGITPAEALGREFKDANDKQGPKTIIGVVNNFHFEDLSRTVRSQFFLYPADFKPSALFVRLHPGNVSDAMSALESAWKEAAPGLPFTLSFLDEKFNAFYKEEKRWSKVVGWAGGISIFLACLGLFGLASLAVVNRTKEIGIRKILGASVRSVTSLLSTDYVKLVVIATAIASPFAWYSMDRWLQNFAYRIEIHWWMFALAGLFVIVIALLTVSFQTVKAALENPAKSLRSE